MPDSDMLYENGIPIVRRVKRFVHSSTEVIPGVFQVTYRGANVFMIVEEQITLIDTGLHESAPTILDFITHIGRSYDDVKLIVLTHNHIDHMGGLARIRKKTGAKVAAHRLDIGERTYPPSPEARYKDPMAQLKGKLRSMFSVMPDDVDIILEGGEKLDVLGGLEVIHTPGHTPGGICLYSDKHHMMITGDLIRKHRKTLMLPPEMVSDNLDDNFESIRKIYEYNFDILCFGHGLPLKDEVKPRIKALIERGKV